MFYRRTHKIERRDIVKLKSEDQLMEVTYVNRDLYHDRIAVIYQNTDKTMSNLSNFHPDSLIVVEKYND